MDTVWEWCRAEVASLRLRRRSCCERSSVVVGPGGQLGRGWAMSEQVRPRTEARPPLRHSQRRRGRAMRLRRATSEQLSLVLVWSKSEFV